MVTFSVVMTKKLIGMLILILNTFKLYLLIVHCSTDSCDHEEVDVPLYTNYLGKIFTYVTLYCVFDTLIVCIPPQKIG